MYMTVHISSIFEHSVYKTRPLVPEKSSSEAEILKEKWQNYDRVI